MCRPTSTIAGPTGSRVLVRSSDNVFGTGTGGLTTGVVGAGLGILGPGGALGGAAGAGGLFPSTPLGARAGRRLCHGSEGTDLGVSGGVS